MKKFELDAAGWTSRKDFYAALLPMLGAPCWHGHNLDALWDSVVGGDINEISPPYTITIVGAGNLPDDLTTFMHEVANLFRRARTDEGVQVFFETA